MLAGGQDSSTSPASSTARMYRTEGLGTPARHAWRVHKLGVVHPQDGVCTALKINSMLTYQLEVRILG
jgi:hypothetical protein